MFLMQTLSLTSASFLKHQLLMMHWLCQESAAWNSKIWIVAFQVRCCYWFLKFSSRNQWPVDLFWICMIRANFCLSFVGHIGFQYNWTFASQLLKFWLILFFNENKLYWLLQVQHMELQTSKKSWMALRFFKPPITSFWPIV